MSMAESVGVTTWHLANGLGEAERRQEVLGSIGRIADEPGGDVVFFSEALETTSKNPEQEVEDTFGEARARAAELGYGSFEWTAYDDTVPVAGKPEHYQRYMMVMGRNLGIRTIRLASRNGFDLTMQAPSLNPDGGFSAVAAHLEDRSETQRWPMTRAAYNQGTDVIFGRLNSMHHTDGIAQLLRLLGGVGILAPDELPAVGQGRFKRLQSVIKRSADMADGSTLRFLEARGFSDADPAHNPTQLFKWPIGKSLGFQLDHIMIRPNVDSQFLGPRQLPGSNSQAISAMIKRS